MSNPICYTVEPEVWEAAVVLARANKGGQGNAINYSLASKILDDKEYFKTTAFGGAFEVPYLQKAWNLVNAHHAVVKENKTFGFPAAIWNSAYMLADKYAQPHNEGGIIRETNAMLRSKEHFFKAVQHIKLSNVVLESCYHVVYDYHKTKVEDNDDHFPGYGRND